jgi:rhamnogalacturonyl hydrolase YesR
MFNAETTALLRAVLDEVCEDIPVNETSARAHVASKILEAAAQGQLSTDALRKAGRKALNPPTMWR